MRAQTIEMLVRIFKTALFLLQASFFASGQEFEFDQKRGALDFLSNLNCQMMPGIEKLINSILRYYISSELESDNEWLQD